MLRPRRQKTRLLALPALVTALILGITACSPAAEEPRQLSTAEAELLSAARFHNFDEGTRRIDMTITESASTITVVGYYDFVAHAGVAEVSTDGAAPAPSDETDYLWWTPTAVGEAVVEGPSPDWDAGVPEMNSEWPWQFFELDSSGSILLTGLALVSATGFDRPDNPQLLAQSDALWLSKSSRGVWFQLPSSDDLTKTNPSPKEDPTVPRMLVSKSGVIERVTQAPSPSTEVSLTFGSSPDSPVPAPSMPAAE
jgi:hypothetical protein